MMKSRRSLSAGFCILCPFAHKYDCLFINQLIFYITLPFATDWRTYMSNIRYPDRRNQFLYSLTGFVILLFCSALSMCNFPFLSFDWFYFLLYFVVAFNAFFIRRSCFLRFTSQPQLAISTVSRICIRTVTWSCVPRTTWMPLLLPCMWNCVNTLGLGLAAFLIELDLAICIFHIPSALFAYSFPAFHNFPLCCYVFYMTSAHSQLFLFLLGNSTMLLDDDWTGFGFRINLKNWWAEGDRIRSSCKLRNIWIHCYVNFVSTEFSSPFIL